MTRISTLRAVIATFAVLVLSANGANAQSTGPRGGPPVVVRPPPMHLDSILAHQQQQSMWGAHVNLQHKRDRLQGASGGGGTKAQ